MDASLYSRPHKKRHIEIKKRSAAPERALTPIPEMVTVDSATECHVTPPDVARRMADYLGRVGEESVLEPHAGTGNLIHALIQSGYSNHQITAVERNISLCEVIKNRFSERNIAPINECFLNYTECTQEQQRFSRIIMNPPFKQVKKHMTAALSLLDSDYSEATLVALVPITYQHNNAETLEELSRDTFVTAKVSTKIIRFRSN